MFEKVLCDSCTHCFVCKHSDEYKAALEAVNETMVHFKDQSMIRVRDITWINSTLYCIYYNKDYTTKLSGIEATGAVVKAVLD